MDENGYGKLIEFKDIGKANKLLVVSYYLVDIHKYNYAIMYHVLQLGHYFVVWVLLFAISMLMNQNHMLCIGNRFLVVFTIDLHNYAKFIIYCTSLIHNY